MVAIGVHQRLYVPYFKTCKGADYFYCVLICKTIEFKDGVLSFFTMFYTLLDIMIIFILYFIFRSRNICNSLSALRLCF